MKKNIESRIPNITDTSFNSLNPHNHNIYHQNEFFNNNILNKTSTNFRTNLFKKEFKNIKVKNNNKNKLNATSESFNKQQKTKIKEMTEEQLKNYIKYLKNNIASSYKANNELNIEYNKLLKKLRQLNQLIGNNNDIYNKMKASYEKNLEKNKKNKNTYIDIIDQYQLFNTTGENKNNNLNQVINSQENDIVKLIKENNKLNEDINNKKNLVNFLKNLIELEKYKKLIINLNIKKNELLLVKENFEKINEMKNKNKELKLNRDKLQKELNNKDNRYIEIIKIKNDLINKINLLSYPNDNNINSLNENKISSDYYNKLIEDERKKSMEIYKRLETKKIELNKIKGTINTLKAKKEEEIFSLNKYIKELDSKNEKIKFDFEKRKKNALEQRLILLRYNQKFKESSYYKKNLISKIEAIKKDNEKLKNKNYKIFNIKAIKERTNNPLLISNFHKLKKNFTFSNLNKNNNIRNKFKNSSYENISKYNIKKYEILNSYNNRKGKYIYTISKNGELISYGIELKKFVLINTLPIKGWQYFYSIYQKNSEGSLFLNTLTGLFILTGENYNQLFYYSQKKNAISLIKLFNTNHKYGGMLLLKEDIKIIILGGEYDNSVILFNLGKNEEKNLPKLNHKRINSSYNIINDRYIISFFGKGNNTIEFLDLKNINYSNNWNILNYNTNNFNFKELSGHICFNIDDNIMILLGGENNNYIIIFYFNEKFLDISDIELKIEEPNDVNINELIFDKEKSFNSIIDENNNKEIIGMDKEGRVHCFNDKYNYTIFIF